jgi:hypothetical protein
MHASQTPRSPMGDLLPDIDGVEYDSVELRIVDPAMSEWRWSDVLTQLANLDSSVPWWIGDALVFGERTWGTRYAEIAAATGRTRQTLKNYAWVARSVPAENRDPELPWSFHRELTRIDVAEQRDWLNRAKTDGWRIDDLRRHLAAARNRAAGTLEIEPSSEDEQGALDRLHSTCPSCGHRFAA